MVDRYVLTHSMIVPKHCILRRNDNITAHGNLKPTSHRSTLHTSNDGYPRLLHRVERINLPDPIFHKIGIITDGVDIDASAERFSGRVQNDYSDMLNARKALLDGSDTCCFYLFGI